MLEIIIAFASGFGAGYLIWGQRYRTLTDRDEKGRFVKKK